MTYRVCCVSLGHPSEGQGTSPDVHVRRVLASRLVGSRMVRGEQDQVACSRWEAPLTIQAMAHTPHLLMFFFLSFMSGVPVMNRVPHTPQLMIFFSMSKIPVMGRGPHRRQVIKEIWKRQRKERKNYFLEDTALSDPLTVRWQHSYISNFSATNSLHVLPFIYVPLPLDFLLILSHRLFLNLFFSGKN